jgi:hypothetical protein
VTIEMLCVCVLVSESPYYIFIPRIYCSRYFALVLCRVQRVKGTCYVVHVTGFLWKNNLNCVSSSLHCMPHVLRSHRSCSLVCRISTHSVVRFAQKHSLLAILKTFYVPGLVFDCRNSMLNKQIGF